MRVISPGEISSTVKELYLRANFFLPPQVKDLIAQAFEREVSTLGKEVLKEVIENINIAEKERIPLCQDTGMAVVFLQVGREVRLKGDLAESVNKGIREAVKEGYLRASVVEKPLSLRKNTQDNTPAVIHEKIVSGDRLKITVMVKGFGAENASGVFLLPPHSGWEGVEEVVVETVKEKGVNACPPLFIGVGVGGTVEKATQLAKEALLKDSSTEKEKKILDRVNQLGIGPGGVGGKFTALRVTVLEYPTHIAGLPVAVNLNCHALRYSTAII